MGLRKIINYFIVWKILLLVFLFLAIQTLPLQFNFLGGGLENYLERPYLWAWANFDGEHYLDIARSGYKPLTYFYFPLYPVLTKYFANLTDGSFLDYLYSGLFISHTAFLVGVIGLIKVIRLDFVEKLITPTLLILFLFPTSFYFGSVYTESLFFALSIWSFYFARTKRWIIAGLLGAFLTATRIVGLALFPALIVEAIYQWKRERTQIRIPIIASFIVVFGLIFYAKFLNTETRDPLEFIHNVNIFGAQRSPQLILLPQVFYRYIFKIIPAIDYSYFPAVFTTWLEFLTAILFGGLGLSGVLRMLGRLGKLGIVRMRRSYVVYLVSGYLIPTLSGSFSSLPRYVLVLFPGFIILSGLVMTLPKFLQIVLFTVSFLSLTITTILFVRGYWVS